ncbi:MAG: sigma-70 family RNA polymerase sigma factor [Chloroflexota bacterium]
MSLTTNHTTEMQFVKNALQKKRLADRYQRPNDEWITAISGALGYEFQRQAHEELAAYLFVVVRQFLFRRQPEFPWLSSLAAEELESLAEDFVQICLEKLSREEFALLNQFTGKGPFISWAAQIALNEARSELRKVRWSRLQPLNELSFWLESNEPTPDQLFLQRRLITILYRCLEQLPESHRAVLVRCVMNGEPAADVAGDLDRSAQAVYNLINRAKKQLAVLLASEDVDADDLAVFVG